MPRDALARASSTPRRSGVSITGSFPQYLLTGVAKQQPATLITGKKSFVDIPPNSSDRPIFAKAYLARPSSFYVSCIVFTDNHRADHYQTARRQC